MVLVYLPTKLGEFVRANVGKYTSTMEHMGIIYQKNLSKCGWALSFSRSIIIWIAFESLVSSCIPVALYVHKGACGLGKRYYLPGPRAAQTPFYWHHPGKTDLRRPPKANAWHKFIKPYQVAHREWSWYNSSGKTRTNTPYKTWRIL